MNGNLHATTRNVNGLSTISSKKLFYQLTLAILVDRIEHAHDLIDKNNDTSLIGIVGLHQCFWCKVRHHNFAQLDT